MFVKSKALAGFLKIRSVFRLLRIFILVRKLNALKIKRDAKRKMFNGTGFDFR
jgi:hypothetical protein